MYLSKSSSVVSTPSVSMPSVNARFVYRIVSVGLAFLILLQMFKLRQSLGAAWFDDREHASESLCEDLRSRGLDDVLVVLKTGANEAREKLPAHFDATLRCVPHYVVYSDMEETIEGHQVHNVLDEVNPTILEQYPDFEYYRQLQEHGMEGFSAAQLAEWASVGNTRSGKDSPGWRLDKWKFLPMADKALRHRPQAKWYIFVEADTFVIWRNIAKWLAHFDASKPYYMGLQMRIGEIVFGYGGAGVVLSNPALTKLVEHRNASLTFYDEFTAGHWAGDCIMGKALQDAGVDLFWSWPTIISENPLAMDFEDAFGGNARKLWCHYAVTYHHLSTREVLQLADFEEEWNAETTALLRHKDIFRSLVLPKIRSRYDDWDNLSDTEQGSGGGSFEECRQTCDNDPKCIQFSLTGRTCRTSTAIKLGHQHVATAAAQEQVVSGWMVERVQEFVKRMDASCYREEWVLP